MLNQIIGVKFLTARSYDELLEKPWESLISGNQYSYVSRDLKVAIGDLVIVPNSGYNDTAVVPAIITEVDINENSDRATRPILAVITKEQIIQREGQAYGVHKELINRELIFKQLNKAYDQAVRMEQIKKMSKTNPTIAALLNELHKQDKILDKHRALPKTQITRAIDSHLF
ncbi:hypothetical protein ACFQAV_05900 [Companilactobacillus huachuanensis]|uniref:Type II toxin-antitoxin system PemK/MazF family toxin n=1 Tax=Companilactobacillus huachuanensis TaxID=2559914 RepID=A0ABW1RNW9_9LACO|nr:hypothetical protein [Companilactobacillus huachuanensis]